MKVLGAAALLVLMVAGCSGSDSGSTSTTSAPETTVAAPSAPLTLVVDQTEAGVGGSVSVHGSGCISPTGDGTVGTVGIGIPHTITGASQRGNGVAVTAAPDGSFRASFAVDEYTPPGDQEVEAECHGPQTAASIACHCAPDGATGPGATWEFYLTADPRPIHVTGATAMTVAPTKITAGGTLRVSGRCVYPGSDYEVFAAWITPLGEPTPNAGGHPATHCTSAVTTFDLTVGSELAPGRYVVHAATSDELDPVIRWFQPVEIEVTGP